jgi:hypothetical protein
MSQKEVVLSALKEARSRGSDKWISISSCSDSKCLIQYSPGELFGTVNFFYPFYDSPYEKLSELPDTVVHYRDCGEFHSGSFTTKSINKTALWILTYLHKILEIPADHEIIFHCDEIDYGENFKFDDHWRGSTPSKLYQ